VRAGVNQNPGGRIGYKFPCPNERVVSHVASYTIQIDELRSMWADEGNITHGVVKGNSGTGCIDGVPR
jgi:hypothetical protein